MKKTILIAMCVAWCANAMAIDCFKDGTIWVERVSSTHTPEYNYDDLTYSIEGDIVVNDKTYMKMYVANSSEPDNKQFFRYLRTDNEKVYFLKNVDSGEEVLAYDFGLQPGDSAEIGLLTNYNSMNESVIMTNVKCVEFTTVTLNDKEFEAMKIQEFNEDYSLCLGESIWIKGVCDINGLTQNGYFNADGVGKSLIRVVFEGETIIENVAAGLNAIIDDNETNEGLRYKLDGTIFNADDSGFYIQNGKINVKK